MMLSAALNASRIGVQAARGTPLKNQESRRNACRPAGATELHDGTFFVKHRKLHSNLIPALWLFLACALLTSTACRPHHSERATADENPAAMRDVTDEAGRRLRLPAKIERVVSLAPNLTEIVFAVGAGKRLVGDTTYCDYPEEAKAVAKVGDTMQPSAERIIALRPQLVLVSTASQLEAFTRQMAEQNIPIYVTDPHDLEGVFRTIKSIGDLLGESAGASKLISELRARADAIAASVKAEPPVRVFFQVSREPLYTAGRDSYITDVIRRAGGTSVTAEVPGAWPRYSDEAALAAQPEAIVMATADSMNKDEMRIVAALNNSPAAKNGRIYGINGDFLSRPGPRLIEGLEEIARKLHPNAFK